MKRYQFSDFITGPKPRIKIVRRQFGATVYSWHCAGRGCEGWGTTAAHAYGRWLRNWKRRVKFYGDREKYAQLILDGLPA